ncbi:MAG: carotenoid oxygenase family protein, partial [Acidimicrobiia bacterium]|nr:carotenoid oxygenase family protein [Acidimicrobiia bacterium]
PWPVPQGPYHWFTGDGMVHGVALGGGQARWYRNRWVRTSAMAEKLGEPAPRGPEPPMFDASNTNVLGHAGRVLALTEGCIPYELTAELDTVGRHDFGGPLPSGFTAHPKVDPATGELLGFAYGFDHPYVRYHVIGSDGALVRSVDLDTAGPTMMHDFAVTEHHAVFFDLPVLFRLDLAMDPSVPFPFTWDDDYGARVGILPRDGSGAVEWFEVDPCYVFHPLNAYEDGDRVVVDVVRYPSMFRPATEASPTEPVTTLDRWVIDRTSGKVHEDRLDDRHQEFPQVDPRRVGREHRYGYAASAAAFGKEGSSILKHDLRHGSVESHEFGTAKVPGEASFVPAAAGAGEDEGWLLSFVYDGERDGSDLVVLDATDLAGPPVAVVTLPQRVPFGFHGNWVPD